MPAPIVWSSGCLYSVNNESKCEKSATTVAYAASEVRGRLASGAPSISGELCDASELAEALAVAVSWGMRHWCRSGEAIPAKLGCAEFPIGAPLFRTSYDRI
jgi:hypothetical protein